MKLNELLGKTFDCTCGKQHSVPTETLSYSVDALSDIHKAIQDLVGESSSLIVADARTYNAAGKKVEEALEAAGADVSHFLVPDGEEGTPAADDTTKDLILAQAPLADVYISVGSGVINDLVKWVAYLRKSPYITVPTAASMNGYASANVAASIGGLKVLFHADACKAVFVEPGVLQDAPYELTASGLGDVLAKPVSSADWKLNQFLFQDYYCQFSVDLLKDLEPIYLENPVGIKNREPAAIKALFEALFYSSVAMTITGTSSPASGGEHLISHTLDMVAARDGAKHDLHGRQVGVASILMAALYEKVMEIETPVFSKVPQQINSDFWGTLSPIVEKEYEKKRIKYEKCAALLAEKENWQKFKELIEPGLVPAKKLKECLKLAEGAHRSCDIRDNDAPLAMDKFKAVVLNANQMRERFTILDLAFLLGILPGSLDQLIEEFVTV
jgi:glycerol-1-phosphate dehydrogenase [NAD(P)+]